MQQAAVNEAQEEEDARARLMLKEAPLKRVARRLLEFRDAVSSPQQSVAAAEAAHATLLRELSAFDAALSHADAMGAACDAERLHAEQATKALAAREEALRERLSALRARLSDERDAIAVKEQCAALMQSVSGKAPVPQLRAEAERLENEIAALERSAADVAARLETRTKQFKLFLQAAALLGSELESTTTPSSTTTTTTTTAAAEKDDVPML